MDHDSHSSMSSDVTVGLSTIIRPHKNSCLHKITKLGHLNILLICITLSNLHVFCSGVSVQVVTAEWGQIP